VSTVLSDALLLLTSLTLYVHTLAPTILPADSGEFQFVSYVLGIAHPPGYPLYTVLAKLCTLLPIGDIAYRVNFFAALTSSLALVVLSWAVRRATGSTLAGWMAAVVMGTTPTFWAQSTTANIRSLTVLFTVLQLGTLIAYAQSKDSKYLLAFAIAFGLGITHHGSTALHGLAYAAFLLASDPKLLRKPRLLWKPAVAFLLCFLVLLYLPLRSLMGTSFDPQPIRSLSSFLDHILARGFRGDIFYFIGSTILASRLAVLWNILTFEFGPLQLALAAWGAAHMLVRHRRLLMLCGGVWLINALTAIAYRAPQTVEYSLPAHVVLAFVCAYGAWSLSKLLPRRWLSPLALAAALAIPLSLGYRHYSSFAQLSQDRSARQYAEGVLLQAPQGALILSNWHYATPLWYLQYVEQKRKDVEVLYAYPEGATPMSEVWLRRIAESTSERPTIVTNYFQEYADAPYQFRPFARAWLVQQGPVFQPPQSAAPLDALFDGRIRFVGFETDGEKVSPADSVTVRLYWQPTIRLDRDYSFFVHLVDETGTPLGQGDRTYAAARYEVGEVICDEHRIPLLPTAKQGHYRLIAGVYITLPGGGWQRLTSGDGKDTVTLGEVEVQALRAPPVTLHALSCPFVGGYTLVGVDYDRSVAGQLRVYLHWLCTAPSTEHNLFLFSRGAVLATAGLPKFGPKTYFSTSHDLPAEAGDLTLELHAGETGAVSAVLGPAGLALSHSVRLPQPGAQDRYISLGGEMLCVRADVPTLFEAGRPTHVKLTFVGLKAITDDYSISVSLMGSEGKWRTQQDGTPALGAIPTLKWIRGVTIVDQRDLLVPADAAGRGVLYLTVYDAFTMRPLPVLDERLARLGQGTWIELSSIEVRPTP
jgi:hypothetical protein